LAQKYTTRGPRHAGGTWSHEELRKQYPDIAFSGEELASEIWKQIPDCPGYLISNLGRVASRATGREKPLKHFIQNQGYRQVTVHKMGRQWQPVVHVLVARLFIQNDSNKTEVNHINGNHADCRACNLEWVTKAENTRHAKEAGIRARGVNHPRAKLTEQDVAFIRRKLQHNSKLVNALAQKYEISRQHIMNIATGKSWSHIALSKEETPCDPDQPA
jgi:hypothetical protein